MEERIEIIERSLAARSTQTAANSTQDTTPTRQHLDVPARLTASPVPPQNDTANTGLNLSCSLGSFPASSINGTTQDDSPRVRSSLAAPADNPARPELYQSKLLESLPAEAHIKFYRDHLDPLIHHVLTDRELHSSLRPRSEFLIVAICTVAAYCAGTADYNEWLELYRTYVTARTFSKRHSFDDVRALCIGALWLSDLATALSALGRSNPVSVCPVRVHG